MKVSKDEIKIIRQVVAEERIKMTMQIYMELFGIKLVIQGCSDALEDISDAEQGDKFSQSQARLSSEIYKLSIEEEYDDK